MRPNREEGQLLRGLNPTHYDHGLYEWVMSLGDATSIPWKGQHKDEDGKTKGRPDKGSSENALRAVYALEFRPSIKLNEWTGRVEVLERQYNGKTDLTNIITAIEAHFASIGYLPTRAAVSEAVHQVAEIQGYNPRVEGMTAEPWDELDRWPSLAKAMCQDKDDELALEICKLIIRGIVVRALVPGAEFPYCPILYSPHHGAGKTDFLKIMAQRYYGELDRGLFAGVGDTQRTITERMRGRSVVEIGEFDGMKGNAMERLKSLVTSGSLNGVRWVYAHDSQDWPMTAIIVGTTNKFDPLVDDEHRRFPVLTIERGRYVDLGWVQKNHQQLYAQADYECRVIMLEAIMDIQNRNGGGGLVGGKMDDAMGMIINEAEQVSVRIPDRYWGEMNERSAQHRETSPLEEFLQAELEKYAEDEMLLGTDLLTFAKQKVGRLSNNDFSVAMKVCGWGKWQDRVGSKKLSVWGRPGATKLVDLRPDPVSLIPQ